MAISGIGSNSSLTVQSLLDMRSRLDDLQRQLGTGQKSTTYAGVGLERGLAVGLRSQLAALGSFDDSINNVGVRLSVAQASLGRLADIGSSIKSSALQTGTIGSQGVQITQTAATSALGEALGLLNTQSGDRYMFSGRATDRPAVETLDHIMNGNGAAAGLKQVIAERNQADLGADGLGRLVISAPTTTTVSVAEDAVSPFGFKLAGVSSSLTGAIVTGPSGSPATASVDLPANPNAGDTIQYRFTLPEGSTESLTLTATTSANPGPNEFAIGATSDITAANLKTALTGAVGQLAGTSLQAASTIAASDNFFATDASHPPQRVAGPPFDTAIALVAGTPADTVSWYTGEDGPDSARSTATATIDSSITVSYGMRANEQGIRSIIQNVATLAAASYSATDPNAAARGTALNQRVASRLGGVPGTQQIADIEADLASAQTAMKTATDRHQQTKSTLADMLQQIEGVPTEDVAAQIMALQTNLQASLQTTSLMLKTSLVNYLT